MRVYKPDISFAEVKDEYRKAVSNYLDHPRHGHTRMTWGLSQITKYLNKKGDAKAKKK